MVPFPALIVPTTLRVTSLLTSALKPFFTRFFISTSILTGMANSDFFGIATSWSLVVCPRKLLSTKTSRSNFFNCNPKLFGLKKTRSVFRVLVFNPNLSTLKFLISLYSSSFGLEQEISNIVSKIEIQNLAVVKGEMIFFNVGDFKQVK